MLTLQEIKEVVAYAAKGSPITKIYLFGSYAKGSANIQSDVDLLVVIPDGEDETEVSIEFQFKIDIDSVAFDILSCTESRLQEKLSWNYFVKNICEKGTQIYELTA